MSILQKKKKVRYLKFIILGDNYHIYDLMRMDAKLN